MIQYIVVNGFPGSGKTTFEQFCLHELGEHGCGISSVDNIKTAAYVLGWDGEKTPEARKFLSILKELSTYYFDSSWNYVGEMANERYAELNSDETLVVFVDVREPREIQRYKEERNAITVFIDRTLLSGVIQSNMSDMAVRQFEYDYYIENNGTLEDLTNKAKWFIINVLKKGSKR